MTAFDRCLAVILQEEGSFVNNASDPGGMTCLGVTRNTWEAWTKRDASEADMRALTPALVAPLYRANYWNVVHGDDLPPALALCVFDFAVNGGPARSARYLQKLVGAATDGQIGPATLAAVKAFCATNGVAQAVRQFQGLRLTYYHQLDTFPTFGRGWLARVGAVETAALRMIP